jgi:anti-sigma regulatory factor (Ser/Thr protein kinase)
MTQRLSLSPVPESPGEARRFVASWLERWGYPELVPTAALITSELATNAVEHTGDRFTVAVDDLGDGIHVAVGDTVSAVPVPHHDTFGRGMQIIDALADSWGTTLFPDHGKLVWCDVRTASLLPG